MTHHGQPLGLLQLRPHHVVRFVCNTVKALQGHPRCTCGDYIDTSLFIEGICGHETTVVKKKDGTPIEQVLPQVRRIPALTRDTVTSNGPDVITMCSSTALGRVFRPPQIAEPAHLELCGEQAVPKIRKPLGIKISA